MRSEEALLIREAVALIQVRYVHLQGFPGSLSEGPGINVSQALSHELPCRIADIHAVQCNVGGEATRRPSRLEELVDNPIRNTLVAESFAHLVFQ